MSFSLYLNNLPHGITIEDLIKYFQSSTKSGGGDVDYDACRILDGNQAVVVFEEKECLDSVLKRSHELDGHKLEISDKKSKARPVPKKRTRTPSSNTLEKNQHFSENARLNDVRTVIVSGFCPDTEDEHIELFFENKKKSGGGEIEKLERSRPDVAHITFVSAEVAANVLKQDKIELKGYHLKLKAKEPEIPSLDREELENQHLSKNARLNDARTVIVSGFCPDTEDEHIELFFENNKKSGGGEIEKLERSRPDVAHITFVSAEVAANVLKQDKLELKGYHLQLRAKQPELPPLDKKNLESEYDNEKAFLGEVRTVIVSGINPNTTKDLLQMFFENKRSGGGEIETLERTQPDIAYITFLSAQVAADVLKQDKLELEGYHLQLKEQPPELILPFDRKKLYLENIGPTTTKDSLRYYLEAITKSDVSDLKFGTGDNRNALAIFDEESDVETVQLLITKKPLEGTPLKISNPRVCNSILITGLAEKTSKQAIEMYFENEKNGGGKIYGDVIYQKDQGKAVVSFCDPKLVRPITTRSHKLDGSVLSVTMHYQFMNPITETSYKKLKLNSDICDHVLKNCENEFRDLFSEKTLEMLKGNMDEIKLSSEMAVEFEQYMEKFVVKELLFSKKLLDNFEEEIRLMISRAMAANVSVALKSEIPLIKMVGKETDVIKIHEKCQTEISNMEEELNVVTELMKIPEHRLQLLVLHDVDKPIANHFNVDTKIEPGKKGIVIKGSKKQVELAKNALLEKCKGIVEDKYDLSETSKRLLKSEGTRILNDGMKGIGLQGMISTNGSKSRKAKVLAFDNDTMENIMLFLRDNMFEKKYVVEEDSLALLNSNKWEEFFENIETNTSVRMVVGNGRPTEVFLVGKTQEVGETYQTLVGFMKRNTIVNVRISLNEGYADYLMEYCIKDLEEIEQKLEEHSVRVQFIIHEGEIKISGTKDGVKAAKKQIEDILANVATDKIRLDKPQMQKYIQSEEGKMFIEATEMKNKCKIRLTEDNGGGSRNILSSQPKPTSKLLCSYETAEKISLKVYKTNITEHSCDVIVNAANGDLNHVGGVAKSILDAGGKEIQEECDAFIKQEGKLFDGECFSGRPGKLPCKRLVHAVGPRWDSSKRESVCKTLLVTCIRALEEAIDYRSIAIPAIGSGIFGIPKEVCADVMIQAAEEFSTKHVNGALKEIHFVNNDDESGSVFSQKFHERFGGRPSFKTSNQTSPSRNRFVSSEPRFSSQTKIRKRKPDVAVDIVQTRKPGDFIVTKNNLKISIVVGDLSTYKADVLVNTTGEVLNLQSNPCSKALSNEAGPTLQAECSKIGKLQVGEVAATKGGNLLCDEVYHVVCVQWNGGQGEQVLRAIVKNCLKKCNSSGKKSIAFPAIGTGILGFPRDIAAKVFFEETKEFENRVSNCDIREVNFVVYSQDTQSIQAFKNELQKQAEWGTTMPVVDAPTVSKQKWRRKPATSENPKNDVMCIEVGEKKKLEIVKGDITKEETDVIAHLTNSKLFLGSGVATALLKAGGKEIELECENEADSGTLQTSTTVLTSAGQLNVKYIAHMVAPKSPESNEIQKCISDCLKTVSEKECQSMSLPAVGTGYLKQNYDKAAKIIITSIIRFLESSSGPLTTVRIVLKDDEVITAFQTCAKKLSEEDEPGMLRKFANFFWKSESPTISLKEKPSPIKKVIFLEIYARDDGTLNSVKEKIFKIIDSQKERRPIEDNDIEKLSRHQSAEIQDFCELNDVKVVIEKDLNRIVVSGHRDDVSKTTEKIYQILKRVGEAEKEKEKAALHADLAEIVSQGVKWFYENPQNGDHEEYDTGTNAAIEKAYSKKEKSVLLSLEDSKCEIVFEKMEETNLDTNEKLKVIRKDLKAHISAPDYWETQSKDANGKESAVHLVLLDPNNSKHKDEYKKISDHFLLTATQQQILQIERIQNPSLLKLYLMKKESLDKKNGSNEKMLFHGTKGDILETINEKGLNRSYSGQAHGTVFGKGVYFARDASMSVGYAPAHPSTGKRYMYYTRAAVGQYAVGNTNMIVPPPKGSGNNDSYDSTVNNITNPTIFVLFYDNQYYPEYLITFK